MKKHFKYLKNNKIKQIMAVIELLPILETENKYVVTSYILIWKQWFSWDHFKYSHPSCILIISVSEGEVFRYFSRSMETIWGANIVVDSFEHDYSEILYKSKRPCSNNSSVCGCTLSGTKKNHVDMKKNIWFGKGFNTGTGIRQHGPLMIDWLSQVSD